MCKVADLERDMTPEAVQERRKRRAAVGSSPGNELLVRMLDRL